MNTMTDYNHCQIFQYWLEDPDPMFFYDPSTRVYTMTAPEYLLKKNKKTEWPTYQIAYCPICAEQFPSDLTQQRADILRNEYGIDNPLDAHQQKLIPKEFTTDEWWKKRGL
jgi:hypothetical protein